jgi:hypothetical protein
MRHPKSIVFVGSTHLPPPNNLLTHAIVASDIPGEYTIAERVADPPWGVTANLCVRGRTSRLRFDLRYPKSGGGEDLDYCAKAARHGRIVAVPAAKAHHPWWNNGDAGAIFHILGWADGEVLCVGAEALRAHIYLTFPNGVECANLALAVVILVGSLVGTWNQAVLALLIPATIIVLALLTHWISPLSGTSQFQTLEADNCANPRSAAHHGSRIQTLHCSTAHVSSLAFWRVDWHFGKSPHFVPYMQRTNALRTMFYMALLVAGTRKIYSVDVDVCS